MYLELKGSQFVRLLILSDIALIDGSAMGV